MYVNPLDYLWILPSYLIDKLGIVYCIYQGVSGYNFKKILYSFVWRAVLPFNTKSIDPDEMQHYAAFHLGLPL